jgi:hypothetical protein
VDVLQQAEYAGCSSLCSDEGPCGSSGQLASPALRALTMASAAGGPETSGRVPSCAEGNPSGAFTVTMHTQWLYAAAGDALAVMRAGSGSLRSGALPSFLEHQPPTAQQPQPAAPWPAGGDPPRPAPQEDSSSSQWPDHPGLRSAEQEVAACERNVPGASTSTDGTGRPGHCSRGAGAEGSRKGNNPSAHGAWRPPWRVVLLCAARESAPLAGSTTRLAPPPPTAAYTLRLHPLRYPAANAIKFMKPRVFVTLITWGPANGQHSTRQDKPVPVCPCSPLPAARHAAPHLVPQ